jgi:hypothetical protein
MYFGDEKLLQLRYVAFQLEIKFYAICFEYWTYRNPQNDYKHYNYIQLHTLLVEMEHNKS